MMKNCRAKLFSSCSHAQRGNALTGRSAATMNDAERQLIAFPRFTWERAVQFIRHFPFGA